MNHVKQKYIEHLKKEIITDLETRMILNPDRKEEIELLMKRL